MDSNVVIIGAGIGGLFTGAFLAKNGIKVTVLEKNSVIGGGLQCFSRHGVDFETGMHVMGGFREGGSLHKICKYLGILNSLRLEDVDDACMDTVTYLSDGITYRIPSGRENFVNGLAGYFPEERENLNAYVDELYRLSEEVDLFYLRPSSPVMTVHSEHFTWAADRLIAHYIDNPKLRDVLAYLNPLYGGVAGHTPAYIHALINVLYINGATRFAGGSQQLADALAGIIRDNGGEVLTRKAVTTINVVDQNITQVTCGDGTIYTADRYISSVHPCHLLDIIDEKAFPKSYRNRLRDIPNSYSAFSLFIELKPESFPYINHTCYHQEDYGDVWTHAEYDETVWPRGFMYMTPPDIDQGPYARRMLINCIMGFEPVERWKDTTVGHRTEEYDRWKALQIEKILDRMELLHPGFRDKVEHVYAASPLTIRDYYNTKDGSIFGYRKDCENLILSQLPIYTKVKNLLLTGQNINLHGICGVPLTAIITAEAVLGPDTIINGIHAACDKS